MSILTQYHLSEPNPSILRHLRRKLVQHASSDHKRPKPTKHSNSHAAKRSSAISKHFPTSSSPSDTTTTTVYLTALPSSSTCLPQSFHSTSLSMEPQTESTSLSSTQTTLSPVTTNHTSIHQSPPTSPSISFTSTSTVAPIFVLPPSSHSREQCTSPNSQDSHCRLWDPLIYISTFQQRSPFAMQPSPKSKATGGHLSGYGDLR